MIDPRFRNTIRLFFFSFKNGDNDHRSRDSYNEYYMSLVEIKDFHALTDNNFFDQPVKN